MKKLLKILIFIIAATAGYNTTQSLYVGVNAGYPYGYGVGVGYGYPYYGNPYYPYGYPYYGVGVSYPAYPRYSSRDRAGRHHWTITNNTGSNLRIYTSHSSYQLMPGQSTHVSHRHSFRLNATAGGQTMKLRTSYHKLVFYFDARGRLQVDKY